MSSQDIAGLLIEPAKIPDAVDILALQRLAYRSEATLYGDPDLPPLKQTPAELVQEFESHTILKAVVGGRLVGSVRAYRDGSTCSIGRLMVDPQFQCRGIGTALMHQIESKFPDVGHFRLFTGSQSHANIRLYRRLGYTVAGTEDVSDHVRVVIMIKPGRHDVSSDSSSRTIE